MASPAPRRGNLPAEVSTFVGRRHELVEVRRTLARARVVTLVGPGGAGKTRLALHAAARMPRGPRDGTWLVDLTEVRDTPGAHRAAVVGLGLQDHGPGRPVDLVTGHLRDKDLLLLVDGCEHVLDAAAGLVDAVVRTCPAVRVVATSREPLAVDGEHVLPVHPFDLPPDDPSVPTAALAEHDAVRLLCERAAAATGTFALTDANRAAVVGVCRRLDGLPLALELAAVKTRALGVQEILAHLDDRFALLGVRGGAPRQRTLEATLDWSHDLLTPDEQRLLRRLAVFPGRFTLEDATGACADDALPAARVLTLLPGLVDKSLVTAETSGPVACHRLHETVRAYAARRLAGTDEGPAAEDRLVADLVHRWAGAAERARSDLLPWLARVELALDTVRHALRRCVETGDGDRALVLTSSLAWYWVTRAPSEGVRVLDEVLTACPGRTPAHAGARFLRGFLAVLRGDPVLGRTELGEAVRVVRDAPATRLLAEALAMRSVAETMAGDAVAGRASLAEAVDVAEDVDDDVARLAVLQARAMVGFFAGDLPGVRAASHEGAALSRRLPDLYTQEVWAMNLAVVAVVDGQDDPVPHLDEALDVAARIDDRLAQAHLVGASGCHAARRGDLRRAARLLGACDALGAQTGTGLTAVLAPAVDEATAAARAGLGPERFAHERDAGAHLDRAAAVALARGTGTATPARRAGAAPLGPRETEVARLVADGLTNKQVGARLFISERTVETHLRGVMDKLGVGSRAQVAGWFAVHGRP